MRTTPPPRRRPVEGPRAVRAEEARLLAQRSEDLLARIDRLCPALEPVRSR